MFTKQIKPVLFQNKVNFYKSDIRKEKSEDRTQKRIRNKII